jgi:hydrophobic/amphiphilic exporter-1 (mainly G- bacteria), HAE1 family
MEITKAAITRPVFILMLVMASFLLGFIAYKSMRLELNPEVSFGTITVNTVYSGAGPDEINTLVSKPIEDAISGVNNLQTLTSSSQEGISTVTAQFVLGSNIDIALNDVRSKVDSVLGRLPDDAERPQIVKFDNSAQPVLTLAFSSPNYTSKQLRDLLDDRLQDRFAAINGVASANVQGGDIREIQIQLDKDRLTAYGLGIADISRQINASTQNVPGGRIVNGDSEYSVRVFGEFKTLDQIRNSVLTVSDFNNPNGKSTSVHLRDIANVVDGSAERTAYSRLDGHDTVVLALQKARDGNAVDITQKADAVIESIEKDYPGIKIVKTSEQAKQISESLSDLNFTLVFAICLVSGIVYLFLHNLRGTLIVSLAIPTCIMCTFVALWLGGFTINNMTMLALILAIGVLVDDAIVVLENITRHLKMGEDPREAALNGRGEIGTAALAITAADVVVFMPIAFMGGVTGQFFKPLALGFVFAVVASLFVSFTLTPMLASRWYRAGEDTETPKGWFAKGFERGFARLETLYGSILEWSLNHRWFTFILGNSALVCVIMFIAGSFAKTVPDALKSGIPVFVISVIIGAIVFVGNIFRRYFKPQFILYGAMFGLLFPTSALIGKAFVDWKQGSAFKFEFLPSSDSATVSASVELPPGSSLASTQRVVSRIEKVMMANPNVKYVVANVGTQGVGSFSGSSSGSNYAQVQATLWDKAAILDRMPWAHPKEKLRDVSDISVAADVLEKLGRVPGATVKVSAVNAFGFGSPIQMSFASEDRDLLLQTVDKLRKRLLDGAIAGVINPDISSKPGKPEFQAIPDRDRLADAGLDVATLGTALRTLYQGNNQSKYRVNGREYDIRVQLSWKDKNNPNLVREVPITFKNGHAIYIPGVATLVVKPSIDKIDRRDREEEVRLTADLLPGFASGSVQGQISALIEKEKLVPEGVRIKPLGQAESQNREQGFLFGAFGLGIILVYMLLASLYDNLLYPFIIQLAQPQAMTGAILALILTDKSLNLVGFIGLITLTGLVGKNAILLVDYTNTLRERGRSRHDALVEAGPTRLRPIAMTTLALIFGTLPIALAIGRGSEFRETIGIVIIGGVSLSTILTLVVIPCSYTIFDDISLSIGRLLRGNRDRPVAPSRPEEPAASEPVVR